jgi:hypothetical protein
MKRTQVWYPLPAHFHGESQNYPIAPTSMNGTFRRLMRDSGMALDKNRQNLTLYSRRHTYATQELFGGTDIHTLAKQMGTCVLMLEQLSSKLTATMAAYKLA